MATYYTDDGIPLWRLKPSQNKRRKTCLYCKKKGYLCDMDIVIGKRYKCSGCPKKDGTRS